MDDLHTADLVGVMSTDNKPQASSLDGQPTIPLAAMSIKLPNFYWEDPQGCFLQADAQFGILGISVDETPFWHVMLTLDAGSQDSTVRETLRGLKSLFKIFSPSKWQQVQRILAVNEVGEWHTSQVADYLLCTVEDLDPSVLMQHFLLQCLPTHVQVALASSKACDIEQLIEEGDKILDFLRQVDQGMACAIDAHPPPL